MNQKETALVNPSIKEIKESNSPNRIILKTPKNGITPIKVAPKVSLVIRPYMIGNSGRTKIKKNSIDALKVGGP